MQRRTFLQGSAAGSLALMAGPFARGSIAGAKAPVAQRIEACRRLVAERMARDRLVGVSAALVEDGELVWVEGFGMADREKALAMKPDSIVGIGSVTKTFTALALMQLQRRGLLDIEAPVSRYVPGLRIGTRGADLDAVTVRAVMNHTSGLPTDVFRDTGLESARYTGVVDLLNATELAAWPQTIGLYSNIGYSLLGNVIRNVAGKEYPDYVKANILAPLAMERSGFVTDSALPERARLYYPDGRTTPPLELRDQPAGGLYADVHDLARYAIALMSAWHGTSGDVIDAASVRSMFRQSNEGIAVETNRKGLGWFMFRGASSFAMYHAGSTGFANASLLLLPETRSAAAILVNTVGGDGLAADYAFHVLEGRGLWTSDIRPAPHLPPVDPQAESANAPSGELDRHAGDYAGKRNWTTVSRQDGGLVLAGSQGGERLQRRSDGSFAPVATQGERGDAKRMDRRYRFADVGPYHVLFEQSGGREQTLGYRVPASAAGVDWAPRKGRYELFGYQIPGNEQIHAAEIEAVDGRLPRMQLVYNTGRYAYPLVFGTAHAAVTGGLGPETTGETVRFSEDGRVLTYSGLTFRKVAQA